MKLFVASPVFQGPSVYPAEIPPSLLPHFQEYDVKALDLVVDANFIIQRTLEFGGWDEIRWLFGVYALRRICTYVRRFGERGLSPVAFNYWRKLLHIRKWQRFPFPTPKGELWPP